MSVEIVPYKHSAETKREQIEKMFDNVSGNYDLLNRVITWRMDKKWRINVLKIIAKRKPDRILDIATGTGDMALLLSRTNASYILSVDISQGMLDVANKKIQHYSLQERIFIEIQDAENLTLPDNSFDVITIIFGVRNFDNLEKGLAESLRVLKPGGVLVVLETSIPVNSLLKFGYLFYTKRVMPTIASLFAQDKRAYTYLSESALKFPYGSEFVKILVNAGFHEVKSIPQMGGLSTIYYAEK
jgi:demethylmenaquinone methyltransferase/2-methoxy-6-polyprenyl-1,4-benzoquinol methylase